MLQTKVPGNLQSCLRGPSTVGVPGLAGGLGAGMAAMKNLTFLKDQPRLLPETVLAFIFVVVTCEKFMYKRPLSDLKV